MLPPWKRHTYRIETDSLSGGQGRSAVGNSRIADIGRSEGEFGALSRPQERVAISRKCSMRELLASGASGDRTLAQTSVSCTISYLVRRSINGETALRNRESNWLRRPHSA
jgi:hypothetical protein